MAVYVISITIVLSMIVIGGIISNILCWFPWYYVNANKCTERRRSTHFIQFRAHCIACREFDIIKDICTIGTTLISCRRVLVLSSDVWFIIWGVCCQNVADNQMFQYRLNANILWPVFQQNIWNFVEILESGENLMPHTQTVTLCYLNSWPGPRTWNINSEKPQP